MNGQSATKRQISPNGNFSYGVLSKAQRLSMNENPVHLCKAPRKRMKI